MDPLFDTDSSEYGRPETGAWELTPEQQLAEWEQHGFPNDYFQICDYFELDLRDLEAVRRWQAKAEDDARCERQAGY